MTDFQRVKRMIVARTETGSWFAKGNPFAKENPDGLVDDYGLFASTTAYE